MRGSMPTLALPLRRFVAGVSGSFVAGVVFRRCFPTMHLGCRSVFVMTGGLAA
jgi:hypothetical protein